MTVMRSLERLCKWRMVFASRWLGTRSKEDPECQAVRDQVEGQLIHRCELSALIALLVQKKVFNQQEFLAQVEVEAEALETLLEQRFPGFKATDIGMSVDLKLAAETMKGWPK